MNKAELIDKTSDITGLSKTDIDSTLKTVLSVITEELARGRKVTLVGFGTFERRNRKARVGVNPQNPEQKIKIPAKKAPAFSPGSELKEAVASGKVAAPKKKKTTAKKKKTTAKKRRR